MLNNPPNDKRHWGTLAQLSQQQDFSYYRKYLEEQLDSIHKQLRTETCSPQLHQLQGAAQCLADQLEAFDAARDTTKKLTI